jgi:TetR/AcrR family transcriptional repressor of nem operon
MNELSRVGASGLCREQTCCLGYPIQICSRPVAVEFGQLAESDPEARALIAAGFDQWAAAIRDGLRSLHADGKLPPGIDPDDLATTLLATLEGGLVLAQAQRSSRSIETAVETLLALTISR